MLPQAIALTLILAIGPGGGSLLLAAAQQAGEEEWGGLWFEDLAEVEPLLHVEPGVSEDIPLVRHIADRVLRPDEQPPPLPEILMADGVERPATEDSEPRIVFISVSDGQSPARVALGRGEGIMAAVEDALGQLSRDALGDAAVWVRVDFVQEVAANREVAMNRELAFEPSLVGVAFERETGAAFLPDEMLTRGLVEEARFHPDRIVAWFEARQQRLGREGGRFSLEPQQRRTIHYFSTQGWFADREHVHRLYRGHRQWGEDLSLEALHGAAVETAQLAGAYVLANLDDRGRFNYVHFPAVDEVHDSYSSLRHAGTIEALAALHGLTGDNRYLEAAKDAIDYHLEHFIQPMQFRERVLWAVREGEHIELGGNARLLKSLVAYTEASGDRQYMEQMRKLAHWLVATQGNDGRFRVHRQHAQTGQLVRDFQSSVYPGEAALALVRMHDVDEDDRWLGAARRAVDYLMQHRDVADDRPLPVHRLPHDVGQALALCELYRKTGQEAYRDRAVMLAGAMMRTQQHSPMAVDHEGAFAVPLAREAGRRVRVVATLAMTLQTRSGGHDDAELRQAINSLAASSMAGSRFVMRLQYRPELAMYFDQPGQVLGGVRNSFNATGVRIDYNQHTILAMVAFERLARQMIEQQ